MNYLSLYGIKLETSAPYVHQQNGQAEREMRTIVECARTMMLAKKVSHRLWAEAINTAAYILNRCVSSMSREKTPYELWTQHKPNLTHVRTFGSVAYAYVEKQFRKKFDEKSRRCILVGYQSDSKNYRLYDSKTDKVIISCDVIFNENDDNTILKIDNNPIISIESEITENNVNQIEEQMLDENSFLEYEDAEEAKSPSPKKYELRNRNDIKVPSRYSACLASYVEPNTYSEAMQSENSIKWKEAIIEEFKAHEMNKTWELSYLPTSKKLVGCKWVFKIKENPSTSKIRYKARLCAKGYSQKEGSDYREILSPVVRYDSVRTLLAIAAHDNLEIGQFDVKTAFINGDLREEIYMQIPDGLEVQDKDMVCKLRKSLYGLKQSARCWNEKFDTFLRH